MAQDNSNTFEVRVITPDRTFFVGEATLVEFNTTEGEIGIYKRHIPMTVIVKPGILTITDEDEVKKAALHSGFAEILGESVTILAEVIEWPDEIDEMRAMAAKERAERYLAERDPKTDIARAETALLRATTRINILK